MTSDLAWPDGTGATLRRRFPDPPSVLFDAFTNPDILSRWWCPYGFRTVSLEFLAVEGRRYKVTLVADDGTRWVHEGVFVLVAPPERLAYTWQWTEGPMSAPVETLVEVAFDADDHGTAVTITHSRFAAADQSGAHLTGWSQAMERLAALLGGPSAPPTGESPLQ